MPPKPPFLARLNSSADASAGEKIFGIGVDEKTALLIDADGTGRLAEGSAGSAWIVQPQNAAKDLRTGKPLSMSDIRLSRIDGSGSIDLKTRVVQRPADEATISIRDGKLSTDSIASKILTRDKPQPGED